MASAAARVVPGWLAVGVGGPSGVGGAGGSAVSEASDDAASSAALRARTSGVRIPSSSCASASRKREASQRMM